MLTPVQRMVRLILQNRLNNSEIAQQTGLARNTVSSWRKKITNRNLASEALEELDDKALKKLSKRPV